MKKRLKKRWIKKNAVDKTVPTHPSVTAISEINNSAPELDNNIEILDWRIAAMLDEMFDEISRQQVTEQRSILKQDEGALESLPAVFDALMQQELKSYMLATLNYERIGRGIVCTTVAEVHKIIEATLETGTTPELQDLAKSLGVKSSLESSTSHDEIIALLEDNRNYITEHYGLNNSVFDAGIAKIKAQGVSTLAVVEPVRYDEAYLNIPTFIRNLSSFGKLEKGTI